MDNLQLKELFDSVLELPTTFDRIIKLKSIKKDYKTSEFYKTTHMPLYRAYKLFLKDSIATEAMHIKRFADAEFVGEYVTNLLDHVSPDAVEHFVDRIVSSLNTNELVAASKEIGEELKKLQR